MGVFSELFGHFSTEYHEAFRLQNLFLLRRIDPFGKNLPKNLLTSVIAATFTLTSDCSRMSYDYFAIIGILWEISSVLDDKQKKSRII